MCEVDIDPNHGERALLPPSTRSTYATHKCVGVCGVLDGAVRTAWYVSLWLGGTGSSARISCRLTFKVHASQRAIGIACLTLSTRPTHYPHACRARTRTGTGCVYCRCAATHERYAAGTRPDEPPLEHLSRGSMACSCASPSSPSHPVTSLRAHIHNPLSTYSAHRTVTARLSPSPSHALLPSRNAQSTMYHQWLLRDGGTPPLPRSPFALLSPPPVAVLVSVLSPFSRCPRRPRHRWA